MIIGTLVVILALVAAIVGYNLYRKLTTNTVVAYFPETLALYAGDKVQIMGVQVGQIDAIDPAGDKMKVTFHYDSKYKVPANATASILNPSLVASRNIQLSPPYTGGPVMEDNAVIPIDRTQVPVEYDELRDSLNRILTDLGPTKEQPKGPFGDIIESAANGFAGKGEQLNKTLTGLSEALYTLNEGRGDFFGVIKSLALFVNALYQSDQQFVALNDDLATFTNSFTNTNREVANALQDLNQLLTTTRQFISKNGEVLSHDINNLADVTNAILQPDPLNGLETALHVFPTLGANLMNIVSPVTGRRHGPPRHQQLRQPAAVRLQRDSGRQPAGLPGVGGVVRPVPGADPRRDQVQLPAIRREPVHHGDDAAQADRVLRAAAAAAWGIQGHHRAGHLLARHLVLARQPRAGLGHRARHAGRRRAAVHREHADPGVARRTDGRTRRADTDGAAGVRGAARREPARSAQRV